MMQKLPQRAMEYLKQQRNRTIHKGVVRLMGCAVLCCTIYALILPAITMEHVYCGMEEHVHSDACYVQSQPSVSIACGVHTHSADCYGASGELNCTVQDAVAHRHDGVCYDDGTLICSLTECEPHTHGASCYTKPKTHTHCDGCYDSIEEIVTCEVPESEEHTHDAACYTKVYGDLICGLEEGVVGTAELICTLPELELHVHNESCFVADGGTEGSVLTCTLTEHTHSQQCYSDPTADVETAADWERTFADVPLSGNPTEDVVLIAKSQLGYEESRRNYQVQDDGITKNGYTRYGAWYGAHYEEWSAMFVGFCLHYGGVEDFPFQAECDQWLQELTKQGLFRTRGEYTPKAGDVVFYDDDSDGTADRVGIVAEVDTEQNTLKTIEENADHVVKYASCTLTDRDLLGYGEVPEKETDPEENLSEAVEEVIALIEAMPSSDEIEQKLEKLADDEVQYTAYFLEIAAQGQYAYQRYLALDAASQELVTNIDRLMESSWCWSMMTLDQQVEVGRMTVHQVNSLSASTSGKTTVLKNTTAGALLGYSYTWHSGIVVELGSDGVYRVSQVLAADGKTNKASIKANNGYFILTQQSLPGILVGDVAKISGFNPSNTIGYQASGVGTITFYREVEAKTRPDKNNQVPTIQSADTSQIIRVNLFDYGSNINDLWWANANYPGFQYPGGVKAMSGALGRYKLGFGDNIVADNTNQESVYVTGSDGRGGAINGGNGTSIPTTAMKKVLGDDGYPALAYNNTSLGYLFSNSAYAVKQNSGNINGLFRHHANTGAYTYNSRENHAQYNASSERFVLYDAWITSNFITYPFGNLLPFNDINSETTHASQIDRQYFLTIAAYAQQQAIDTGATRYQTLANVLREYVSLMDSKYGGATWGAAECISTYFELEGIPNPSKAIEKLGRIYSIDYDVETDFFFGMNMEMNFMQPKGGMTGPKNDQKMVFEFTGDDDVWVFIDGVLFLDLTGIHRHFAGTIDFVNGQVQYYTLNKNTGEADQPYLINGTSSVVSFADVLTAAGKSTDCLNEKGTFKDYSTHEFKFYYMERGSGSSVCRMNFNFPLLRENTISVSKELTADSDATALGNPWYSFQVVKAGEDGADLSDLFISPNTAYQVYDAYKNLIREERTDEHGVFRLKAGETAEFIGIEENAGRYYVRELLNEIALPQYGEITVNGQTTTISEDITIGSAVFTGADSPEMDMSNGSTVFQFSNHFTTAKLGSLEITKVLETYPVKRSASQFDFTVTLDGVKLPVGTAYTVSGATRTVTKEGIITLAAGETAVIKPILAGTAFTVEETSQSAEGYLVLYEVDGAMVQEAQQASGVILTESAVKVKITNAEEGAQVSIPVTKSMHATDGIQRPVTFTLNRCDVGGTVEQDSESQTITLQVTNTATGAFTLNYVEPQLLAQGITFPHTFYYRIAEADHGEMLPNSTWYLAQVEITKPSDGAGITATMVGLKANGTETVDSAGFVNTLAGGLRVTKTVIADDSVETGRFDFTLKLAPGDSGTTIPDAIAYTMTNGESFQTLNKNESGGFDFTLQGGQTIEFKDLPYGAVWTITETNADGFTVTTQVDGGAEHTGTITTGSVTVGTTAVAYTNTMLYRLPETGGLGITPLYGVAGLLLTGYSTTLLLYKRRKCRKEET